MTERSKTGGRQIGTPNKSTQALKSLIEDKYPDFNPILAMIEIAQDMDNPANVRTSCLKEIASYLYPKRKALELSTEDTAQPMQITIRTHLGDEKAN